MMQYQPIVKRVNGAHEWAHRPYQLLSLLLVQTQAVRWKAVTPGQLTGAHLYLDITKSGYLFYGFSGGMINFRPLVCPIKYVPLNITFFYNTCQLEHVLW